MCDALISTRDEGMGIIAARLPLSHVAFSDIALDRGHIPLRGKSPSSPTTAMRLDHAPTGYRQTGDLIEIDDAPIGASQADMVRAASGSAK